MTEDRRQKRTTNQPIINITKRVHTLLTKETTRRVQKKKPPKFDKFTLYESTTRDTNSIKPK